MTTVIACLVAFVSTAAFLSLWFWVVWRELQGKTNVVQSAKVQVYACQKLCWQAEDSPETEDAQSVLSRSEDIYRQSVAIYNLSLQKFYNRIPGFFMGFRQMDVGEI